jgi:hypothetical protein
MLDQINLVEDKIDFIISKMVYVPFFIFFLTSKRQET